MTQDDLIPEWNRSALETLREPLESGHIRIARAARSVQYPARFQLVAAIESSICLMIRIQKLQSTIQTR
ncbi:hypothetical protein CEE62_04635 [Stenotrophomonas maltophilia]|nr:hypothetical protein CEE62_04635 [Stenotrophomonas maltophilia]